MFIGIEKTPDVETIEDKEEGKRVNKGEL